MKMVDSQQRALFVFYSRRGYSTCDIRVQDQLRVGPLGSPSCTSILPTHRDDPTRRPCSPCPTAREPRSSLVRTTPYYARFQTDSAPTPPNTHTSTSVSFIFFSIIARRRYSLATRRASGHLHSSAAKRVAPRSSGNAEQARHGLGARIPRRGWGFMVHISWARGLECGCCNGSRSCGASGVFMSMFVVRGG